MDSPRPSDRPRGAFHPRPSPLALVLSLVLVGAAVVFGIFGRSIAGRLSHGGGMPLADLVSEAEALRAPALLQCVQERDEPDLHLEEARGIAQRTLRRPGGVPDLSESGYALRHAVPVQLPYAGTPRSVCLTYRGQDEAEGHWLHLFLVPDDGQFLSFDSVGRPRALVPDLAIEGELPGRQPSQVDPVLVWSDGTVLRVACFDETAEVDRVRAALGVP